jgi:hypothetical protein
MAHHAPRYEPGRRMRANASGALWSPTRHYRKGNPDDDPTPAPANGPPPRLPIRQVPARSPTTTPAGPTAPDRIAARERYDDLSMRDFLSRAYAKLVASCEYDPARHGAGNTEPLTAAEHLELLATAEYLARSHKPSCEVDQTLRAEANWAQVAEALGTDEAMARVEYPAWADGQHDMLTWTEGRLGMSDAEYVEEWRCLPGRAVGEGTVATVSASSSSACHSPRVTLLA